MVDFSQYMNKPLGEMKRITLPEGHYYGRIKQYEGKESAEGKKPMLAVQYVLDSAGSDVDTTQLPPQGVSGKIESANYMMDTDFGQDDIRKMIEATGIPTDPAQPWGQYLPQIVNQPVLLYIGSRRRDKNDPASELMDDVKKVLNANTPIPAAATAAAAGGLAAAPTPAPTPTPVPAPAVPPVAGLAAPAQPAPAPVAAPTAAPATA